MEKIGSTSASTQKEHQCEELVIDLEPLLCLEKCCIYKVPENLRKLKEEVYTPQLISIGPLHHGNDKLAYMEEQKSIYLSEFHKRELHKPPKVILDEFESDLRRDEKSIRKCYSEKSGPFCSDKYVKMILLDAVFIIELFLREFWKNEKDYMLEKLWLKDGIQQDLLLLENQLPFFVLNDLYNSAFPGNVEPTFHALTLRYFQKYKSVESKVPDGKVLVLHFTDFIRHLMFNESEQLKSNKSVREKNIPSAVKLHEAGVKFKTEESYLTNIKFDKGKGELKMLQFKVEDSTERVFRNLMALEQCHYPDNVYICHYIFLMDSLINTVKDVDLLVNEGVIINWLGSNEDVAELVNKLCINNIQSSFSYNNTYEELNNYRKKCWPSFMATMFGVYFNSFWSGTASVVAFVLVLFTVAQTVASFLAL